MSEIYHVFPVPFGVDELTVIHIAAQRLFGDVAERYGPAVEGCQKGWGVIGKKANFGLLFIMQVVNSDDGGGIVERSDAKFEIFQIAGCVPLAASGEICS